MSRKSEVPRHVHSKSEWPTADELCIPAEHRLLRGCSANAKQEALQALRTDAERQLEGILEDLARQEASAFRKMLIWAGVTTSLEAGKQIRIQGEIVGNDHGHDVVAATRSRCPYGV